MMDARKHVPKARQFLPLDTEAISELKDNTKDS